MMARQSQLRHFSSGKYYLSGERCLLAVILLGGAWARLSGLDLGWFMHDQTRDALEAIKIAEGQSRPLIGPDAGGLPLLGPLYYYLLAIPFWFSRDPFGAALFTSLLNLFTVYLTYRLGKCFFDRRVGLIAAGLYAVFPMAVIHSKALWNPGFIPVFTTCFMYALLHFLVYSSPWGMVGALVALACALQIHLSTVALGLLLILGTVWCRPSLSLKHLVVGLVLFLIVSSPLLVHEIMGDFEGLRQLVRFLQTARPTFTEVSTVGLAWRALTVPFLAPVEMLPSLSHPLRGSLALSQRLELTLFLAGFFYLIWHLIKGRYELRVWKAQVVVLLWVLLPTLTLVYIVGERLLWYYFDCLYPSQFLVIGIAVSGVSLPERWAVRFPVASVSTARRVGYIAVAVVTLSQAVYLLSLQMSIVSTGVIRFTPRMLLGLDDELTAYLRPNGVVTMPVRYKRALTERVSSEFQVDRDGFALRIHGPAFEDLREDKGFFPYLLVPPSVDYGQRASGWHYLMVQKEQFPELLAQKPTVEVGPFLIVPYRPLIRSRAWVYATTWQQGWFDTGFDDSLWTSIRFPARGRQELFTHEPLQLHTWEGPSLYVRGWIDPAPAGKRLHLVVGLKDGFGILLSQAILYVNGELIEVSRTLTYHTPSGRNFALVFDISRAVKLEPARIALQVIGTTASFNLDIYELLADELSPWR